ncbi:MAG: universal stress protein [Deltaproteobacteria bacterium]
MERLRKACRQLPVPAQAVVRDEVSLADAILDEARVHDADLVVLGAQRRSWLERLFDGGVATRVVNRAQRSVLVTPMSESSTGDSEPLHYLSDWGVLAGTHG